MRTNLIQNYIQQIKTHPKQEEPEVKVITPKRLNLTLILTGNLLTEPLLNL